MLQNYLKCSFRALLKSPLFTALNVGGLAIGLTVSLLLFLHVQHERGFDLYHSKSERIHRVNLQLTMDDRSPVALANAPIGVGPAAKEGIAAVEQYARLLKHGFGKPAFITAGENKLVEESLYWTDSSLLALFDLRTLAGDLGTAFSQPNTVALSRSAAIRYFGTSNPIGRSVQVDHMQPLEVRAVYEDFPDNSTLDAAMIGSLASVDISYKNYPWSNASFETWLLLGPDANPKQVQEQLGVLLDKNVPKEGQYFTMSLQPLKDVHLQSSHLRSTYSSRLGDRSQVNLLGILAMAILLIACFNYMNLATARSQLRYREVGINKTMGASRKQLAYRFYIETALLVGISLALALVFLQLSLPAFNQLADKELTLRNLFAPATFWAIFGIAGAVTLFAGSYPAFILSAFSPKNLLQTTFRKDTSAGWMRRTLVTVQFTASVVLIIGTVVLYRQMQFIQQKNLGFQPGQVLAVNTTAAENDTQLGALMQNYRNLSSVDAVCQAQTYPAGRPSGRSLHRNEEDENGMLLWTNHVSPGIEKVLGLQLLAGNPLPEKYPGDTMVHVLLNKTAVDYLQLTPEEVIGKKVMCELGPNAVVTGVLEDFHAESLHRPIGAYAFHDRPTESRNLLLVKLNTTNLPETMQQVESSFRAAIPQSAFQYTFLDEHLDKLYRREHRTARVVFIFSLLSVFISCLGLFGLVAFAAEQRRKEIGIRRVLGATVPGITRLLAGDFMQLVLFSIAVAIPLAWWGAQNWLEDFAYHIEIQWWMFAAAGVPALAIALLTVGFQGVRAALANPVDSLRNE